jgi:hypothetical protein
MVKSCAQASMQMPIPLYMHVTGNIICYSSITRYLR